MKPELLAVGAVAVLIGFLFVAMMVWKTPEAQCERVHYETLTIEQSSHVATVQLQGYDFPDEVVLVHKKGAISTPRYTLTDQCFKAAQDMMEDEVLVLK